MTTTDSIPPILSPNANTGAKISVGIQKSLNQKRKKNVNSFLEALQAFWDTAAIFPDGAPPDLSDDFALRKAGLKAASHQRVYQ